MTESRFKRLISSPKKRVFLALGVIVVIGTIVGIYFGVTQSKNSPNDHAPETVKCNYQIKLVFEYECDGLPPNYEDKFESALIHYHEYVSEKENQRFNGIGVTVLDKKKNECVPSNQRKNLGNRRNLLRGLRRSSIHYNLFAFCFGKCPTQALPSISTSNRRSLEEAPPIEFLSDTVPFLEQFQTIFQEQVNLVVTKSTTNTEETTKIDCDQYDVCYNNDGICCGQSDCTCKTVSQSLCTLNECDLAGGECCEKFSSCQDIPSCQCLSQGCNDVDFCCHNNHLIVCNGICPIPTGSKTGLPTNFPTPSNTKPPTYVPTRTKTTTPTNWPTQNETNIPTHSITIFPSQKPTNVPSHFPTTFPTQKQTSMPKILIQKGDDIDGESAYDKSGWSVSLSSDGMTVAIGAFGNNGSNGTGSGHVRVYGYSNSSWLQIGADIDGESAGDLSGQFVSLSSDGMTVAIGAMYNDGINGNNNGHVRIYDYLNGSWIQKGADVDGESEQDYFGASVSLSSDGMTVAIGGHLHDGNGANSGYVQVYDYINGSWIQKGQNINGESTGDFSGWSLSLSSNGMVVAVGAYMNDGNNGTSIDSGHVRVYGYSDGSWIQIGADIDGEEDTDHSGYSVSLSSDGMVVAVGASYNDGVNSTDTGHVRVYEYINNSSWIQKGQDIDGETAGDHSGRSVSLSSDGMTIAIGANENDGMNGTITNSGHVRLYSYSDGSWIQIGADIDGEGVHDYSGVSVSLSSDGMTVAIGAYQNDGMNGTMTASGHVQVYQLVPITSQPSFQPSDYDV